MLNIRNITLNPQSR